jgi:hypothetical protein
MTVSAPIGYTLPPFSVALPVAAVITTKKIYAVKHDRTVLIAALVLLFFAKVSISGSFVSATGLRVTAALGRLLIYIPNPGKECVHLAVGNVSAERFIG